MKSMTGYGWGECARDGFKVTVELSSVNRKQGEISINLPHELDVLEARIRDEINRVVARGRLSARVSLHAIDGTASARVQLNKPLARAYVRELNQLAKALKLSGSVSLDLLLRAPGVLQTAAEMADAGEFWPAVSQALRQALNMLVKMRHREQLIERIKSAGLADIGIEEDRLVKEVVYFADRSDISEELTRLKSHFQQFDDCLKSAEPVGRTLDFLAQEMNREINTIGSKANDTLIAREVVTLKTELEKFREQAQNVE